MACDNSCSKFEGIVDIGFGDSLGTFDKTLQFDPAFSEDELFLG